MTEWETSSFLATSCLETWSWNGLSPFKVSQLSSCRHDQNKFDCSQMPPYKATNVTTFHTQGQLLHVHPAVFHLTRAVCTSNAFKLGYFYILNSFVITQHTIRESHGSSMLPQQHPHTVQQEFKAILFQWKTKLNLYAIELTTHVFILVPNFCV